jgi:hypothetical protein
MIDGLDVYNSLQDAGSWEWWTYRLHKKAAPDVVGNYVVSVVKVHEQEINSSWYGGEAPQGWQGEAYIIFKVTEDNFNFFYFKKFGTISSYLATTWDGKFLPVRQTEKKVIEYVYE